MTELEQAIRDQPATLRRVARMELPDHLLDLRERERVWLVGTGTSRHAADLGALALQAAGVDARAATSAEFVRWGPSLGPADGVVVISHTGETAHARAARESAREAGAGLAAITAEGAGWPEAVEVCRRERSHTYTVSYTAALAFLFRVAGQWGVAHLRPEAIDDAAAAIEALIDADREPLSEPERELVLVGAGPAAITAREGALKLREAARVTAQGFDPEHLLHGSAVPLDRRDLLVLVQPDLDPDGLVAGIGDAATRHGVGVVRVEEPVLADPLLLQLPLTARLQLAALDLALAREQDPDRVIVGAWDDDVLWARGAP
jgi:glutamine---fructose-6-phosphate transaminase (isomerizing)